MESLYFHPGKLKAADMKFLPIKEPPHFDEVDITDNIEQLDGEIKNCVIDLQSEKWVFSIYIFWNYQILDE